MSNPRIEFLRQDNLEDTAIADWKKAMNKLAEAKELEKKAREYLLEIFHHEKYEGKGVKIAEVKRSGSVEYDKIPELRDVDLEMYRKEDTYYWKVSLSHKK